MNPTAGAVKKGNLSQTLYRVYKPPTRLWEHCNFQVSANNTAQSSTMNFYLRFALVLLIATFCKADEDADSTRIAECRSQCLDKFLQTNDISFDTECKNIPNCLMCWESCRLLQESFLIWGPMCSNTQICFPGCQQACSFHFGSSGRGERAADSKPKIVGRFSQPLHIKPVGKDTVVLNWTPPHSETSTNSTLPTTATKFVYVISRRTRKDSEWQEISQTSDLMVVVNGITPGKKLEFKVTAIISNGVFASAEATYISHFNASQDDNKTASEKLIRTWDINVSLQTNNDKDSIEATLSWTPPQPGEFMIIWEIVDNNFDVKGHLYTDTTTATITLEKASIYRIHVQMVSTNMKSEAIEIDTGRRHPQLGSSTSDCTYKAVLLSISGITLCLFVMFVIFFFCLIRTWKSGNCFPPHKRNSVTPLKLNDIEYAHNSLSSDTMPPSVGIIMGSLEKLSQSLSPAFNEYTSDGRRLTPPAYEVHDSNPATPQVNHCCQSAKKTTKNHIFKF